MDNRNRIILEGLRGNQTARVRSHYRRARRLEWSRESARRDCRLLVTMWTARNAIEASRVAREVGTWQEVNA